MPPDYSLLTVQLPFSRFSGSLGFPVTINVEDVCLSATNTDLSDFTVRARSALRHGLTTTIDSCADPPILGNYLQPFDWPVKLEFQGSLFRLDFSQSSATFSDGGGGGDGFGFFEWTESCLNLSPPVGGTLGGTVNFELPETLMFFGTFKFGDTYVCVPGYTNPDPMITCVDAADVVCSSRKFQSFGAFVTLRALTIKSVLM